MGVKQISVKFFQGAHQCECKATSISAKFMLMLNQLKLYAHKHKTRKVLANLSAKQLKDIGLSQAEANIEAGKFFWQ